MARLARHIETGAHRGHLDQPEWRVAVGGQPVDTSSPAKNPSERPLLWVFSQVLILDVVEGLCFDRLLQTLEPNLAITYICFRIFLQEPPTNALFSTCVAMARELLGF